MIAGYEGDCMGLEKGNIVLDVGLDSVATGRLVKGKWRRLHGKGERSEHYHCIAAQVAMRMTSEYGYNTVLQQLQSLVLSISP